MKFQNFCNVSKCKNTFSSLIGVIPFFIKISSNKLTKYAWPVCSLLSSGFASNNAIGATIGWIEVSNEFSRYAEQWSKENPFFCDSHVFFVSSFIPVSSYMLWPCENTTGLTFSSFKSVLTDNLHFFRDISHPSASLLGRPEPPIENFTLKFHIWNDI